MKDNWLVDYSEDELEPGVKKQVKAHLESSKKDLRALEEINGTKENLRAHADELPELDEVFFDQLHDKIMIAVETKEIPKAPFLKLPKIKRHWFLASSTLGLASAVVLVALTTGFLGTKAKSPVRLASTTGFALAEMTSYQNSADFMLDVANRNLDQKDLEKLFE